VSQQYHFNFVGTGEAHPIERDPCHLTLESGSSENGVALRCAISGYLPSSTSSISHFKVVSGRLGSDFICTIATSFAHARSQVGGAGAAGGIRVARPPSGPVMDTVVVDACKSFAQTVLISTTWEHSIAWRDGGARFFLLRWYAGPVPVVSYIRLLIGRGLP